MPKRFIGADPLDRPELFIPLAAEPALHGTRSLTVAGIMDGGLRSWDACKQATPPGERRNYGD